MVKEPTFDLQTAHHYFAVTCFNKTWDLMEKKDRTPQDDLAMLHTSLASLWHWTQRADCTAENLSIGYWQVSRLYALLKQAQNAKWYGELTLQAAQGVDVPPFCLGYAHEALARAAMVAGDAATMNEQLTLARSVLERMTDEEARKMLQADLETINEV